MVRICGFHPQGPGSTPGLRKVLERSIFGRYIELGFADLVLKSPIRLRDWEKVCNEARYFSTLESIPMLQNKRPTRASKMRVRKCGVPNGLVARICGSHPEGPGSNPGLGIVLERSSVGRYIELGFADFTLKSRVRLSDWEKFAIQKGVLLPGNRLQCNRTGDQQEHQN